MRHEPRHTQWYLRHLVHRLRLAVNLVISKED